MAKYKVLALAYINSRLHQPGEVAEFDFVGPVPEHLEPIEKPAVAAKPDPISALVGSDLV